MAHYVRNQPGEAILIRRRQAWRDTIEGVLSALVLVLIIRHFAFEVFKIPTGSMAPTLLGQHRDIECRNCGLPFPVDAGPDGDSPARVISTRCPNCFYPVSQEQMRTTFCKCFPSWPKRFFWRGGNRVIVNKFRSDLHEPERWQVVVFKYPLADERCLRCKRQFLKVSPSERHEVCPECHSRFFYAAHMNYIKRLIGLPGERITIHHGDIYADGILQRKPRHVQNDVWRLVYDSRYKPKVAVLPFFPRWETEEGTVVERNGGLAFYPGPTTARVRYAAPITDYNAYNDIYNERNAGVPVGDLQWIVTAQLESDGALRFMLTADGRTYSAAVQFGNTGRETMLAIDGASVASRDYALRAKRDYNITFAHVDGRLELTVDGQVVLEHTYERPLENTPPHAESNGAAIAVDRSEAMLKRVRLTRDLYYLPGALGDDFQIDDNGYFVMGDNTRNSSDSREWGSFPTENFVGRAVVVWWPLNQLRPVY